MNDIFKTGTQTSEFRVTLLTVLAGIVGVAASTFAVDSTAGRIAGLAVALLAALGYTGSRTRVKVAQAESLAVSSVVAAEESEARQVGGSL